MSKNLIKYEDKKKNIESSMRNRGVRVLLHHRQTKSL